MAQVSGISPFDAAGCGQVEPAEPGQEVDVSVVTDPTDPQRLVAAWVQDSALGIVVSRSTDGGRTWSSPPTVVPGLTTCSGGTDEHITHARLAAGPDGVLYLAGEALNGYFPDPRSGVTGIPVSTSTDGGATWSAPVRVDELPVLAGFDTLAAEPDLPGAVVVAWHSPEPVATLYVSRSTDRGATWTRHTIEGGPPDGLPFSRVVAAPDGALHLFTVESTLRSLAPTGTSSDLVVRTSRDKGETWSEPLLLAADVPGQWPSAGAGRNGTVVVTWVDQALDGASTMHAVHSPDGGASWSLPEQVADDEVVGAEPSGLGIGQDGSIGVAFTTPSDVPDQFAQVLAQSRDGGATWTTSTLTAPFRIPVDDLGYVETAAAPAGFVSVFVQSSGSEGNDRDVFVARVRGG